jgi:hypothetical protein
MSEGGPVCRHKAPCCESPYRLAILAMVPSHKSWRWWAREMLLGEAMFDRIRPKKWGNIKGYVLTPLAVRLNPFLVSSGPGETALRGRWRTRLPAL